MSDVPEGPGWWLASDGRYYPPQPDQPLPPPPPPPGAGDTATQRTPGDPSATPPPDEGPSATSPPPVTGDPSAAPAPGVAEQNGSPPRGKTGLIIGIGIVVLFVVLAGVIGALAQRDDDTGTQTMTAELDESPTTTADEADGSDDETTAEPTTTAAGTGDPKVTISEAGMSVGAGYDDSPRGYAGAVLVNAGTSSATFFEVIFTFKNAEGLPVGTETTYVYAIDPGGTAHAAVESVSLQGPATSVDASVVIDEGFGLYTGMVLPVTVTSVGPSSFGGVSVAGTASNPSSEVVESGGVQCVLRRGGKIVGGVTTSLDTLVAGGSIAWDTSVSDEFVSADAAECSGGVYN